MPDGRSAAVFDLDGTLIPNASAESTFFFHLLRTGGLTFINIFQMAAAVWTARFNLHDMIKGNKRYLRSKKADAMRRFARNYFEPLIDKLVFPGMKTKIEDHRKKGDLLLLLSGTLDIIASCFTRRLQFDGFRAATLEIRNGRYTGRITGILPYGIGKLEVLRELKDTFFIDTGKTTLYANIYSDRFVMNAVEFPIAVNPDRKLRQYALKFGWQILDNIKARK